MIEDIKAGVRYVLANYSYVDKNGIVGWGGSFGGFACNWLAGHNEDKLFATLVSHAGDADQWEAYGSTEELWFPEWELHVHLGKAPSCTMICPRYVMQKISIRRFF